MRGDGSVFRRGEIWWIQYYRNGRKYRESARTRSVTDARRLLRKRLGEIAEGKRPSIQFEKVTFDELAEDFIRDYRINKRKSHIDSMQ